MSVGLLDSGILAASSAATNLQPSFAKTVTRVMPSGDAPILAISSQLKRAQAINTTHSYWKITAIFQSITLGTMSSGTSATTLITGDTTNVVPGQVYALSSAIGEQVIILTVTTNTNVTVKRGAGVVTGQDFATGTVLYLVGSAYAEGTNRPTSVRVPEVKVDNYTQIFKNAWSVTGSAAAIKKFVGADTVQQDRMECLKMHARDIEFACLFGQKYAGTEASSGLPVRKMDGIIENARAAGRYTAAGSTTNFAQLETALDVAFDYNTDPAMGNRRVLFVGSTARKVINSIGRSTGVYEFVQGSSDFGLQFETFRIGRGSFDLVEHPLLNTNAVFAKMAISVDLGGMSLPILGGREGLIEEYSMDGKGTFSVADAAQDAIGGSLLTEMTMENRNAAGSAFMTNLTAYGA